MNNMLHRTGYLLMILSLASCSLAPEYKRPILPVASTYPSQDGNATASSATLQDWSHFYTDKRLNRLIALALDNNRDLRLASLNSERLQAQYRIRMADQWPAINAEIAQERVRPESTSDVATYGLSITEYELDLFGRVHSLKDAALAEYFSSVASRHAAQISLIAAVAATDLTLRTDEQLLQLAREALQSQQDAAELAHKRVVEGLDSDMAYQQHITMVQDAVSNVAQREQQRAQDMHALLLLLGVSELPADLLPYSPALDINVETIPSVPAGLPADLLTRRPDILAAEQQLMATNANIGAARAAFFPRIALTGSYGRASTSLSNLFDHSSRGWSFSPKLTLPIFDFGANEANLDVAKAEKNIAVAEYEKTIQTAFREVADALSAETTLRSEAEASHTKAEALRRSADLATQRYLEGSDSRIDQLAATSTWIEARQTSLEVRLRQQLNLISLYKSLGGGWNDPALITKGASHE